MAQSVEASATSDLFAKVLDTPAAHVLARRLEQGGFLSWAHVSFAAHPFLAVLLRVIEPSRPILFVTDNVKAQEISHQDVSTWMSLIARVGTDQRQATPLYYPAWEVLPHEGRLPHADVISERLETLGSLIEHSGSLPGNQHPAAPFIITSVAALLQRTFPPAEMRRRTRALQRGDRTDPLDFIEWLEEQGYEPEAKVTQKGEISLRGGIVDLYPPTCPWPVRLEFFGDELESLRQFDPLTQISREEIAGVRIPPAGELGLLKRVHTSVGSPQNSPGSASPPATLLNYLPPHAIVILAEPELIAQRAEEYSQQVPAEDPFFITWEAVRGQCAEKGVTVVELLEQTGLEMGSAPTCEADGGEESGNPQELEGINLTFENMDAFRPVPERAPEPAVSEAQRREFFGQMHRWLRQGYNLEVFCNNEGEKQRFGEIWEELGPMPEGDGQTARPLLRVGNISRGFVCDEAKLVVVTDAEVFGRYRVQRPRRLKSPHAQAARSALDIDFAELEEGDFVVHLQHGIGRYLGLTTLPSGAGTKPGESSTSANVSGQECLVIEYAPNDPLQPSPKLYVPVTEAHLVSKYVGTGKARPPLNRLGGTRWAKAKEQAERAVRDVASELLAIQAARESQPGHAFRPDQPWQREFEASFIYEETADQLRAILETKGDMERPKPMDRLICGDVGFGKTEVGIRAAFKAVMDGKQTAVLVPTTVLAQQHYNTFRERMADYPVRVELLSRFRTRRAQGKVVRDLAAGGVDIVIGTHRLLQSDVAFKDLGLVIIDEEQRFGVLHKEKFKMLRHLVDVLTLSATPIPRTLYLALSGARDMSTIQTPPHDRLPVQTIVTEYDERLIREAIQRELNRGGQVFFLHNRVMTIHAVASKLANLVPQARIVVGHGQMHSDDLEEVMTTFVNGEADVLLSTTIIESGLDIPNANTIIIDRADRFGLSDLYQLRGRVGRYKHQAYAYMLLPRHARLLTDVRKRMSAIKQYSTLGSGFKIAMRDLEIRGAGNLLGAEQSGHITAVGFELYCQLLKQSVAALKGEKVRPRVSVQVRFDFLSLNPIDRPERGQPGQDGKAGVEENGLAATAPTQPPAATAYLPFKYISEPQQRIEIYRKLAQATDKSGLEELGKELRDRFGPLPEPVELLLQIGELKVLAAEKGISEIEVKADKLMLTRQGDYIMVGSRFPRLTRKQAMPRLKEIKKVLLAL